MQKTKHISLVLALAALSSAGCSGADTPPNEAMGGSSAQSGAGGDATGGGGTSSSGTGGDVTAGGGTGGTGAGGMGTGGSAGFTQRGACGQRGEAPVNAAMFGDGFEEYYILGDRGFDPEVCIVRFVVKRRGDAPPGCLNCLWTHLVGYETPSVVLDTDGVCANSELAMNSERMDEIVASTAAYGFVSEFSGHNSVIMRFEQTTQTWEPYGNATWDPETDAFRFDRRIGPCLY